MSEKDSIDRHIALWRREVPGLDPVVEGVVVRMQILVGAHAPAAGRHGLKGFEYDIIWNLRALAARRTGANRR
ncbi:hypothetical protein [Flindersiella endophytica]